MKERMDLLQVAGISGGGVGRHLRKLVSGLAGNGHRVTVVYAPHSIDDALGNFLSECEGVKAIPLPVKREVSPASDLQSVSSLLGIVRREGPFDVIHGHSAKGGVLARIAARLNRTPVVYTPHSLISSSPDVSRRASVFYNSIERGLGWSATDALIAVSEDEYDFVKSLKLLPKDRMFLVPNGIEDAELDNVIGADSELTLAQKPLTFGTTMRFVEQKDPLNLIRAFAQLTESLPGLPVRLLVAGDGELFAEAEDMVRRSGLDEKITFVGWCSDVREFLSKLDVFVVSSLYEAGLSYSTMEAMAERLPIVSTSVFGTRGSVSGVSGNVLVPVGDTGSLFEGMKRIATLADGNMLRSKLREIGDANHELIKSDFRQSVLNGKTIEVYERVAGVRR